MNLKLPAFAIATLLLAPCALCLDIHDLSGGASRRTAVLAPPSFFDTVNITLPAECFVLGATVNVTGLPAGGNASVYPRNASLSLEGRLLWGYAGRGYGDLGRQTVLSDGASNLSARFGQPGGSAPAVVNLPLGARVLSASLEIDCSGPEGLLKMADISGSGIGGQLGGAVSPAGDFNADGFGDFLVGARTDTAGGVNAGQAFLYYGGPSVDATPDLVFTGLAGDLLGCSVAAAGDLNGDGFDDIAIGAARSSVRYNEAGRVLIFFGGREPDGEPDVVLNGSVNERFGTSVAGLGDFNGDGFDDLAVGTDTSNISNDPGRAYIFLGGSPMDRTPALKLLGEAAGDYFGVSVAGAGDLNGDGFGDLAVGAILNDAGAPNGGRAYVYFGGRSPDGDADVSVTGKTTYGWLGYSVAGAGDFDGDGYDDLLVGAPMENPGGPNSGAAYLLAGGRSMDGAPDLVWPGAPYDNLGFSVAGAGDLNGDGFDDIVLGAPQNSTGGASAGAARLCYGGAADNSTDFALYGGPGESMGWPVSGAGNVNGDGLDDLLLGMPYSDLGGINAGRALVCSRGAFVDSPGLKVGGENVWDPESWFAGTKHLANFSDALNRYLASAQPSSTDAFGNRMASVPLELFAGAEGALIASALDIRYEWAAPVMDFSAGLNSYITGHRDALDAGGNLTIPLELSASTAGRLELSRLDMSLDEAPFWTGAPAGLSLGEDTSEPHLLDLGTCFRDDIDPAGSLSFGVASVEPPGIVRVEIADGRWLSADASTGDENDNWTGAVAVMVSCADSRGLTRYSAPFVIDVTPVNDAPAIISSPVTEAYAGRDYEYRITAVDAERDRAELHLSLGPDGMSIDPSTGALRWRPPEAGSFPVSLRASDGRAWSFQNFTITVTVINKAPLFVSAPSTDAVAGMPYSYGARAVDPDGDTIEYSLVAWPSGMAIGREDGRINWTVPANLSGEFPVTVKASDGNGGEARQEYILRVLPFVRPRVTITATAADRTLSGRFIFSGAALAGTLPVTSVQVRIDSGAWTDATGNATWGYRLDTRKLQNGPHTFEVRAADGLTFSDTAGVGFTVENGSAGGWPPRAPLAGLLLGTLTAAGAAAFLVLRRNRRRPEKYDWGPD
jgi:hypothetical protein